MCNMGISGTITQTEVITGAPGCYNWQGNAFMTYRNPKDMFDTQKTKFPNMNDGNIYMGYSVDKQRGVLSRDEDTVVTGAPRDQSKGSVFLAQSVTKQNRLPELQKQVTLEGEQVGSYFGNSLAVMDINNDGWKDIIVGAPFYFNRSINRGGAVYVFMNENGSFNNKTDIVFTGPRNSGFGMAVAAIGDVNQDGFQDFAVGAPFHDTGRVYVWMGSKTGISNKPSQVIEGKDITNGGFRTFGYSISGGLDVDRNSYPDIVVGSLDDRVALLRARPVIHLTKTFTVMPPIVDPTDCGDSCIEVKVCFSYTLSTGDSNFRQNITVKFTVDADLLRRSSVSRVRFLSNNKDSYTGYLSMPSEDCQTLKLGVVAPVQDKVTALSFSLNVSLYEPESSSSQQLQSLDAFPVMSQREAPMDRTEIHFQKACGPDNKCESNLQMTAMFAKNLQEIFPVRDGQQVLLYDSSIKKLSLLVNVSNTPTAERPAEDAHNALLNITIPPSLRYSGIRSESSTIECRPEGTVLCELGDPFTSNQMASFAIIFETAGITLDTQEIQCVLQLLTLSIQNDLTPLTKVLMVEYILQTSFAVVPQRVQTEFSGKVVGESAMKATRDIGSPVEFSFMVNVVGKPLEDLGYLQVDFDWPTDVDNGKWLLYLSEIKMTGTSTSVCVPPGNIVNPLNLEVSEHHSERMKREVEGSVESVQSVVQPSLTSQRGQRVSLGCVTGGAQCQTFTCPLQNMTNTATVTVQARLWNSTMLEDYKKASTVEVYGQATLRLNTSKPTIRMENQTAKFSVEITPARQHEAVYEVPMWIIIVSALAGVLLLAIIILLLWKCGFFRRANTRELYEAKAQKAEMRTQPSDKDRLTEEE
ncbi:integrin alpha-3-like isoform X2 [Brachyhypopomus gauderio]